MTEKNGNQGDPKEPIENNAATYVNRGAEYLKKDDYDSAITAFSKAIELDSNNIPAYVGRGVTYRCKGNNDHAITDFDKAIELAPSDALAHRERGITYYSKKDYERAITDFDETIRLGFKYFSSYAGRGLAYYNKGDYDHAITDFGKAIELDPNNASAYAARGIAYHWKNNNNSAFADFGKAVNLNPNLKSKIPYIYISSQLQGIDDSSRRIKSLKYCLGLWGGVNALNKKLLKQDQDIVSHYTSLDVLEKLLSGGRFRLYNATYMNDPEEGETFFTILRKESGIDIDIKEKFYKNPVNFYSPAYIGSFTKVDDSKEEDKLFLWRTYGKHKNQDASGACMIFKSSSYFSKDVHFDFGAMKIQDNSHDQKPPNKLYLYEVVYQKSMNDDIRKGMKKLAEQLDLIDKECLKKEIGDKEKDLIRGLVRELLDEIRFLFKGDHYSEENEMRVVSIPYISVDGDLSNSEIKEDISYCPPRLYMDAPEGFHFDKVLLGPQATGLVEWQQWARLKPQGRGIPIEKSKIPYKS